LNAKSFVTEKQYIYGHSKPIPRKLLQKRNIKRPTKVFHAGHIIPLAIYIHEFLKKLDPFPATEIQILLILSKW
jgi:hypothetical protein